MPFQRLTIIGIELVLFKTVMLTRPSQTQEGLEKANKVLCHIPVYTRKSQQGRRDPEPYTLNSRFGEPG